MTASAAGFWRGSADLVGASQRQGKGLAVAVQLSQCGQMVAEVDQSVGDQVGDGILALQQALDAEQRLAVVLEHFRPDAHFLG